MPRKKVTKAEYEAERDRPSLEDVFKKKGITRDFLANKLKEELEAGDTQEIRDKEGKTLETKHYPLWSVRQRARQDAHKLLGDYPAEKVKHSGDADNPIQHEVKVKFIGGSGKNNKR